MTNARLTGRSHDQRGIFERLRDCHVDDIDERIIQPLCDLLLECLGKIQPLTRSDAMQIATLAMNAYALGREQVIEEVMEIQQVHDDEMGARRSPHR